uniref:Fibronectin-binding domain-containing protein n=1 Tax=Ignisphaera aggregans TaxID=334771 RepID=A0A7C2V926_9CREN
MTPQVQPRKKNSMSWLDLKIWLKEQHELLEHSYVDNLYYIDLGPIIIMKMYNSLKGFSYWFIIEPSKRVSISFTDLKPEKIDTKVQAVWRALLKNCLVMNVTQIPCERILSLTVDCRGSLRKLVVELLPRGVICVLDSEEKILLCNEYKNMRDRSIRPGHKYQLPPTTNKCLETPSKVIQSIDTSNMDITRFLIRELGAPPEIAEAIAILCNLKNKNVSDITNSDVVCIDDLYNDFIKFHRELAPCIVYNSQGDAIGFYPFVLPQFKNHADKIEIYPTINEAINKYFEESLRSTLLTATSQELKSKIESIKHAMNKIDRQIAEMKNELSRLSAKIAAIESNYAELEHIHECVVNTVKTSGWDQVKECGPIIDIAPNKGIYRVEVGSITLELDVKKNFIENYNSLRKNIAGLKKSISRAEKEKELLNTKLQELTRELEIKESRLDQKLSRRLEWYESYIWYVTSRGFLVIGGKDASQNIKIVRKIVEPHDIVLHADIHGASTVVIKSQNKNVDKESIYEAAVIAACYSKAWKLKIMSIDVFWVYGYQISLSAPPGQYLPKGSYMVYGEKNYIRNVELRLAIGVELVDHFIRTIIGPEKVIDNRALAYFVVIPGDDNPIDIAKEFIEFLKLNNLDKISELLDPNEIAQKIPGKSAIVRKVIKVSNKIQRTGTEHA